MTAPASAVDSRRLDIQGLRAVAVLVVVCFHAGVHRTSPVSRVLATRPLVALGDVSYSWYLWHWPLIVFAAVLLPGEPAALVIAALGSLLPAWLSYRFVEQPLRMGSRNNH